MVGYQKWMDKHDILVVLEEEKLEADLLYKIKTIKDSDVQTCLEVKPICNLYVSRYRRMSANGGQSDSEDNATPTGYLLKTTN